jgi:O6-methylguanine-DNA--protein-cysteine methyltransferase
LIIPCHRVVAVNDLGGYAGGIETKKKLLEIESFYASDGTND